MGKVERFCLFIAPDEHECVRPVGFDPEVNRKKRVGVIGDGQRFRVVFCEYGEPYHSVECQRRLLAGLTIAFRLICLDLRRERLPQGAPHLQQHSHIPGAPKELASCIAIT